MNLQIVIEILDKHRNEKVIEDLLYSIYNEEIMFHPGFLKNKPELESLYSLRLKIAKEINQDKFTDDEIKSWEKSIIELKNSKEEIAHITWIDSEDKYYLLFLSQKSDKLITYFWLKNKTSINGKEAYNDDTISKGYSVGSLKFYKGELAKEWK